MDPRDFEPYEDQLAQALQEQGYGTHIPYGHGVNDPQGGYATPALEESGYGAGNPYTSAGIIPQVGAIAPALQETRYGVDIPYTSGAMIPQIGAIAPALQESYDPSYPHGYGGMVQQGGILPPAFQEGDYGAAIPYTTGDMIPQIGAVAPALQGRGYGAFNPPQLQPILTSEPAGPLQTFEQAAQNLAAGLRGDGYSVPNNLQADPSSSDRSSHREYGSTCYDCNRRFQSYARKLAHMRSVHGRDW